MCTELRGGSVEHSDIPGEFNAWELAVAAVDRSDEDAVGGVEKLGRLTSRDANGILLRPTEHRSSIDVYSCP